MRTTTFNQVIDGETYSITVPMHRVEAILNRVDKLLEKNKFEKAHEVIKPFIGAAAVAVQAKPVKTDPISAIIEEFRGMGRYVVMDKLMATGMAKASAYYRARKAGL